MPGALDTHNSILPCCCWCLFVCYSHNSILPFESPNLLLVTQCILLCPPPSPCGCGTRRSAAPGLLLLHRTQKENEDEEEKDQVYCTDPTRRATYEGKARLGRLVARVRAMQRYKMARGPNATKNSEGSFPHTGLQLNYRRSVVVMLCCEWSYPTQGEASIVGAVENTWKMIIW